MTASLAAWPFTRYLMVGVLNTFVGYGVILLLQFGMGLTALAANAGGYAIGLLVSYTLNRQFTFRSHRSHRRGLPAFLVVALLCYGLNVLVLWSMLDAGYSAVWAQGLAVLVYTVSSYLLNRHLVFRLETVPGRQ